MPRALSNEQQVTLAPRQWCRFNFHAFFTDEKVKVMTNSQVGMYLKLLAHQWQEGSLPKDRDGLMAIVGISDESGQECEQMIAVIKACFQRNGTEERLMNPHLEEMRATQIERYTKLSQAGRLGGIAKARLMASPRKKDLATDRTNRTP
jgi:uncharacterized protein YdaU (DUF1376 family)